MQTEKADNSSKYEKIKKEAQSLNKKRKSFLGEFRDFALKGNAMSLAVGVIIGAAFQGLINSIVNDLINPIIGTLFKMDFSNLFIPLFNTETNATYLSLSDKSLAALKAAGLPVFAYGSFIATLINFFLLALVVFLMVRVIERITTKKDVDEKAEAAVQTPETKKCPFCTEDIPAKAVRCPRCTSMLD